MRKIPPKQRFSRHALSGSIPEELLKAARVKHGVFSESASFRQLSGGFMNANYLLSENGRSAVFRFYSTDFATADRETAALTRAKGVGVKVPEVYSGFEVEKRPVSVLEFVDGVTLEDYLLERREAPRELFSEIGAELAKIHRITFTRCGFLNGKLEPEGEFEGFGEFLRSYIRAVLTQLELRTDQLNFSLNRRLRALVEEKWGLVLAFEPARELVHCDFNPKNLLVSSEGKLLSVLDWEFCLSGNGIEDLGNFFRFSYDYPDFAKSAVAEGYRSIKPLQEGWEDAARLADLGSMCSFLERKESYPETFHTARTVIAGTLEHFGY